MWRRGLEERYPETLTMFATDSPQQHPRHEPNTRYVRVITPSRVNPLTSTVVVKHQGKRYELELDPASTGETFKIQLFSLTGVEPERQKILVKGGQLKDDTDLSKLAIKPGHTFMMMGSPGAEGGGVLQRPAEPVRFLEDMTEAEAAQASDALPAGLQNLGNTCYMNSSIQALRSIPELQQELVRYSS